MIIYEQLTRQFPSVVITPTQVSTFIFEERVKLNCFHCAKYSKNWTCPPKIPQLDYRQVLSEYEHACFVHKEFPVEEGAFNQVRHESTVYLHKVLLNMEKFLFEHSSGLCLSFIGGSCKLCKDGCGKEACNNPYQARIPIEATGVNVVKTASKHGIDIKFPATGKITRIGLILW